MDTIGLSFPEFLFFPPIPLLNRSQIAHNPGIDLAGLGASGTHRVFPGDVSA